MRSAGIANPDGRHPPPVTSIRKAVIVGAAFAVLAGGVSSLATARLTDRQSDFEGQRAEITQLTSQVSQQAAQISQLSSQVSQQKAQIARLASSTDGGAGEIDRLNAEIAAWEEQVRALQSERVSLEEQLAQLRNPPSGPPPTARLTVNWVRPECTFGLRDENGDIIYGCEGEVIVCVTIENTSDSAIDIYYSYFQFSALDAGNFVYPPRLPAVGYGTQLQPPLMDGQLSPGEKRRGALLYDVPPSGPSETVIPAALARLVWNTGFGEPPEIAVDLSAPTEIYYADNQC